MDNLKSFFAKELAILDVLDVEKGIDGNFYLYLKNERTGAWLELYKRLLDKEIPEERMEYIFDILNGLYNDYINDTDFIYEH